MDTNSTTNLPHFNARAQHLDMSVGGEFVVQQIVELLWARRLMVLYNMSVAGKMLCNKFSRLRMCCTTSTTCWELVRWWCPCSGVWHLHVMS